MPRATSAAVTLLRLGGILWVLGGMWSGSGVGGGAGVLVMSFFWAVAALYFGIASGIRHRQFLSYVLGLMAATAGAAYSVTGVRVSPASLGFNLALLACLLARSTREYVSHDGPPAPRRRGPFSRLDDRLFGPPGLPKQGKWGLRRT